MPRFRVFIALEGTKRTGWPIAVRLGWLTNFHSEESVAVPHKALVDLTRELADEGIANPTSVPAWLLANLRAQHRLPLPTRIICVASLEYAAAARLLEERETLNPTPASVLHLPARETSFILLHCQRL